MSCNGCRVLRKGCKDDCILRQSIECIENPQSQGYATLFVARFFGRAGLFSFISAVPPHQRPALFQSLLFEAAGRTVNPVSGSTGLLWTGNWNICQSAVDTVLQGGILTPEFNLPGIGSSAEIDFFNPPDKSQTRVFDNVVENIKDVKRKRVREDTLSDESDATTAFDCNSNNKSSSKLRSKNKAELKLLRLFV